MKRTAGRVVKTDLTSVLKDTQSTVLKPGLLLSPKVHEVKPRSRPHSCEIQKKPTTNPSTSSTTAITSPDFITSEQTCCNSKDNSSKIPLRVKPFHSSPRIRKSSLTKPSTKIVPQTFRCLPTKSSTQNELSLPQKRSLETQFQYKKKQMDHLRNEIFDKQKALLDLYQNLVQLKKKLKLDGKESPLSTVDLLTFADASKNQKSVKGEGEANEESKINADIIQNMNTTIQQICKFLMMKRLELVEVLEKISNEPNEQRELKNSQALQDDNSEEENVYNETDSNQKKILQEKLNNTEKKLAEITAELDEAHRKNEESTTLHEKIVDELKEQHKRLEKEMIQNNLMTQSYKEKNDKCEFQTESLKKRLREMEEKLKKAEYKCAELQKAIRY